MQNLSNFLNIKRIYFIGIGGVSLSALASIMYYNGMIVAGSDVVNSETTEKLKKLGIKIFKGHHLKNIKNFNPDFVVFTGAISQNNEELMFCKNNNIVVLERADFINKILPYYNHVISIAGTHGKTTTTSMISEVFCECGLNPTVHIGGESVNLNSNFINASNEYFITEACEYRKSFLKFNSDIGVILNVEEDHPDSYKNLSEIQNAFLDFSKICKKVVINENYSNIFKDGQKNNVITFGTNNADFFVKNVRKLTSGGYSFSVFKNQEFYGRFKIRIFGKHNILNAVATIAVCDEFGIEKKYIKNALNNFSGVKRRFEKVKTSVFDGEVYFDYAHHPTEIKKLISEVGCLNKPIICIFQPHTYSRTKKYFENFLTSFNGTYQTIFYKTYKAREAKIKGADAKDLYKHLKQSANVFYYKSFKKIIKHLKKYSKPNCVVLFVGAGDIYNIKKIIETK